MKFNISQYEKILEDNHILVIYSGHIWADGIDNIAEMLLKRLEFDDMPFSASQSIFSIFIEQINNMMMYSADKEYKIDPSGKPLEISKGTIVLGVQDTTYFIQCGNVVSDQNAKILKERIDYLNTLDKKELRQYYKQQLNAENDNLESKGAGIGLIEIARRASDSIVYEFEPLSDGLKYFAVHVTVKQGGKE
ncbi:MAG: SiaB family protein kinase [Treponema sp.]|jgi:hypothetical protein|nr:SiaB family protein kinase [Treponema sp.]